MRPGVHARLRRPSPALTHWEQWPESHHSVEKSARVRMIAGQCKSNKRKTAQADTMMDVVLLDVQTRRVKRA